MGWRVDGTAVLTGTTQLASNYPEWFPFEVQHPLLEQKKAQVQADAAARAASEEKDAGGSAAV